MSAGADVDKKSIPTPVYFISDMTGSNDASFLGLFQVLVQRKWIFLLCLIASVLLAIIYLNIVEPVYQAEIRLLPPQQKDVQQLTIYINGIQKPHTPEEIYKNFIINTQSLGLRREFFDTRDLKSYFIWDEGVGEYEVFQENFNTKLSVGEGKQEQLHATIKFQYMDPKLTAQWLNEFVLFINDRTVSQLREGVLSEVHAEVARLQDKLMNVLTSADGRRKDEITKLEEALKIAKVLGLTEPSVSSIVSAKNGRGVAINTAEIPLYMRGVSALEEEVVALRTRKSNKSFVLNYRDVEQKILMLKSIQVDRESLSSVRIDMAAVIPYQAEWPKKYKVLALSMFIGLVIGIGIVLVLELTRKIRVNLENVKNNV